MTLLTHEREIPRATGAGIAVSPTARRAILTIVCLATVAGVALLPGDAAKTVAADPALATLMRGMAYIKAALAVAGFAAVFWRFGMPVGATFAVGYGAGAALIALGAALIAKATFVQAAAVFFHAGLLAILVLAWKDDMKFGAPRRR